jgi:drug/metabolite transporter (DMT)-like permease
MLVAVALWGLVFVGNHQLLRVLDPGQLVTLRFLLVGAVFALVLAAGQHRSVRPARRDLGLLALCGLLAVPLCQLTGAEGQRFLSPPLAAMLVATGPISGALMAAAFLHERISRRHVLGLGVALSGVALIVVLGSGTGASASSNPLGAMITILSPTAWAAYTTVSKPLAARLTPVPAVAYTCIAGAVFLLPLAPHAFGAAGALAAGDWAWLAVLAVGGTVGPYLLWFHGLRTLAVNAVTPFMYLVPVFATAWTVLLLGEVPAGVTLLGGVLVVCGVALTQLAQRRASSESAA